MQKAFTTILLLFVIINLSSAQSFRFYHTNNTPRFIKPGTDSDTLLNPFAGGLNAPQFSNIDWNGDGINDLFIFDKEARKVYCYVYQNGRFIYSPSYDAAFPFYLQGFANLKDHNFDGKPDLFTASFSHNAITEEPFVGPERMQLFVNKTTADNKPIFRQYSNELMDTGLYIGFPWYRTFDASPIPAVATAFPAIEDIDGDGDLDILSNIGINMTNIFYENLKRNKFNIPFKNDTVVYLLRDQCWGFISYNFNHYFHLAVNRNTDMNCDFQTWSKKAQKHADQSTLLIDLNGDGIKDAVIGDFEHKSLIALTNGRLLNSIQADSIISQDTLFLSNTTTRKNFIEYPAAYYVDVTGDNKKELVISTNSTMASKTLNNIWIYDASRENSILKFTELPGNDFLYKDMIDLGLRSAPVFVDIDNDGDKDLIIATSGVLEQTNNNHDKLHLYLNITDSISPVFKLADSNFADISSGTQGFFFAHPTFGDLNGDNKPDLIIGEGNGNLAYFENTSVDNTYSFSLVDRNAFSILSGTYASPQLIDLDKDGLLDLVVGNTVGTIKFYKNTGTKTVPEFNAVPTIDSLGKIVTCEVFKTIGRDSMVDQYGHSTPHVVDLNNDGIWELITGSTNGRVYIYTNVFAHKDSIATLQDAPFIDFGTEYNVSYNKRFGGRTTVTTAYLDGDNKPDIVLGNIAGGLSFLGTNAKLYGSVNATTTIKAEKVKVYPNPASTVINLALVDGIVTDAVYEIIDITGKSIKKGNLNKYEITHSINITDIKEGLYFMLIKTPTWQSAFRLLINR